MSDENQEHDFSAPLKGWVSYSRTVNQGNYSSAKIEVGKEFYLGESTHEKAIAELREMVNSQADVLAAAAKPTVTETGFRRGGGRSQQQQQSSPQQQVDYQRVREYASTHDEAETERILTALNWKPFGPGKQGEWAFAKTQQGRLIDSLVPIGELVDILRETGARITVGEYQYLVKSEGRFLNRYHARDGGGGSR